MVPGAFRARSSPLPWIWIAALLVLGVVTLGLVHHESARRARARSIAEPLRPIVVVDLATNRAARGGAPLPELEIWTAAAGGLSRAVELYEGDSLAELLPRHFAAWILPAQEQLADDDWDALDEFLAAGGGVVVTGRTGRRDPSGALRGRSTLELLFPGERFVRVSDPRTTPLRVVGRDPIAAGFAPGERLEFGLPGREMRARSPGALAWGDHDAGTAALHGSYRGAPVAWLGFAPQRLAEREQAARITRNALRFAARQPVLDLRPWPEGRPCAVLVGPAERGAREAGCRSDGGEHLAEDAARLAREGCRYATVPVGQSVVPEVIGGSQTPIVAIPEPEAHHDAEGAALLRELLADYERAETMGSVFSLRADQTGRKRADRAALVESVGAELGERGAWFARPEQVADWWIERSGVEARLQVLGRDSARVWFRNTGTRSARDVTARVYLPEGSITPRLEQRFWRPARLRLSTDRTWLELVAAPLDPGGEVSYTIRF